MPEYLSPGIYMEEVDKGARPIEGVGTAMAAFVGYAPAGPIGKPRLITSWSQYKEVFGAIRPDGSREPHLKNAFLSHAVEGYFLNGGTRCYVSRINMRPETYLEKTLEVPSRGSKADSVLKLSVKQSTRPLSDIQVMIKSPPALKNGAGGASKAAAGAPAESAPAPTPEEVEQSQRFGITLRCGEVEERWTVTLNTKGSAKKKDTGDSTEVLTLTELNERTRLVKLDLVDSKGSLDRVPASGTYVLSTSMSELPAEVDTTHLVGDVTARTGTNGLELLDDVTMVCCPDLMAAHLQDPQRFDVDAVKAVQLAMIAHCERMGDRVAILDPRPNLDPQGVGTWRQRDSGFDSKYAALYYPWIYIDNPLKDGPDAPKKIAVPPCGHIAGVWARSDSERGVHKAPANEVVRGALDPVTQITKGEQDTLNPIGVNCIRTFTGRGIRVWGARTVSSDPAWRYLNVRRLFNYVEKSIENGTQWIVFEPNDMDLWARVKRDISAFLTNVWRDGMLFGRSPDESFYVKCDEELNPVEVRDQGKLIIEIGLAPVKPAEFVIFRMSQWAGGGA